MRTLLSLWYHYLTFQRIFNMTNQEFFTTMIQGQLETAIKDLESASKKFNECPSHYLEFDYPTNIALNFELKEYFQYLLSMSNEVDLTEGSDQRDLMAGLFQNRVNAVVSWKIQKSTVILKFWFNVAQKFKLNIGDFARLRYSI